MAGPPGSDKTLTARALPGILPPLTLEEALVVTHIYSVAGALHVFAHRAGRDPATPGDGSMGEFALPLKAEYFVKFAHG